MDALSASARILVGRIMSFTSIIVFQESQGPNMRLQPRGCRPDCSGPRFRKTIYVGSMLLYHLLTTLCHRHSQKLTDCPWPSLPDSPLVALFHVRILTPLGLLVTTTTGSTSSTTSTAVSSESSTSSRCSVSHDVRC